MQRLEVSCAVRPIYGSLGAEELMQVFKQSKICAESYQTRTMETVSKMPLYLNQLMSQSAQDNFSEFPTL
jgi:hypothetical protein